MTAEALVNGTSYTTLVAHSQESFKNAVEFYKNFLSLMKLNDKNANEATLYNSSVCLKIVLEEDSSKNQAAMHRVTKL